MMRRIKCILFLCTSMLLCSCSNQKDINENNSESLSESTNYGETSIKEQTSDDIDSENSTQQDSSIQEETTTPHLQGETVSYIPNGRTPQLLLDVFLEDEEFIWVEMTANEDERPPSRQMKLSKYNYRGGVFYEEPVRLGRYRVVDIDGDGYNEVILDVVPEEVIIFHYENDKVYGYVENWRSIVNITTSGIVRGSSGASYCYDYRIQFNGESYTEKLLSLMDGDKYYLDGKLVAEDKYWEYINELNNQEKVPDWTDYEKLLNTR